MHGFRPGTRRIDGHLCDRRMISRNSCRLHFPLHPVFFNPGRVQPSIAMKPKCGGRERRGGLDECQRRPEHRDSLGFLVGRGSAAEAHEGQQGRSTTHSHADLTHRDHHSVLVFRRSERRNAPTACETPRRTVSSDSATSSHGARQAQRRLGLGEQGWSAGTTRSE
jgi:hypothetical protein